MKKVETDAVCPAADNLGVRPAQWHNDSGEVPP
jgi:hypothetical protein